MQVWLSKNLKHATSYLASHSDCHDGVIDLRGLYYLLIAQTGTLCGWLKRPRLVPKCDLVASTLQPQLSALSETWLANLISTPEWQIFRLVRSVDEKSMVAESTMADHDERNQIPSPTTTKPSSRSPRLLDWSELCGSISLHNFV